MEEEISKKASEEQDEVKREEKPHKVEEGDRRETTGESRDNRGDRKVERTERIEKGDSRRERPPYQNQQFKTQRPNYTKKAGSSSFYYRKKVCKVCTKDFIGEIDYKNVYFLKRFITERGKILPRRLSGFCAKHHRLVIREIKRARTIALLSYTERGT